MPIVPLSELTPVPTDWLWPGWLAAGHLHVLDGDPGVGKSTLLGDLAARLSTGRPWPDGAPSPDPASVILLNAEDDAAGTTRSRLAAAGADMARVLVWHAAPGEPLPLLPGGLAPLHAAAVQSRPRLIVLDPAPAFLDRSVNFNSDPAIRRALAPLAALAAHQRCAVLLVRHLTKQAGGRPLYRGLGSIGLIAACRIAWLAAPHPKNPGQTILAPTKNNLMAFPISLAFTVAECTPHAPREDIHLAERDEYTPTGPSTDRHVRQCAAALTWLGPTPIPAADLIAALPHEQRARTRARQFLSAFLKDAPRTAPEIAAAARSQELSVRTLRRAAKDLKITFRQIGNHLIGQSSFWLLPGQSVPKTALDPNGLDQRLESLEHGTQRDTRREL